MEDVLDLYAEPYDPTRPVVCVDETLVTWHADVQPPLPVAPGRPDYEYERQGTANLFVAVEPLGGWRGITATARRTKVDFARYLKYLADERYPDATLIRLVSDQLNIHDLAVLYLVYPPAEARRLFQRFELHHTPKHASWLNIAELEINVVERACLQHRVPNADALTSRVTALTKERNAAHVTICWRFGTALAREKLHAIYPNLIDPAAAESAKSKPI
jgi:hypothetical protein